MIEIVSISLENEMDLILAHKRSMKLAELCGLSVLLQTSFATGVSEISRCFIGDKYNKSTLYLGLKTLANNRKEMVAKLSSSESFKKEYESAVKYANRLIDHIKIEEDKNKTEIILSQKINFSGLINNSRIEAFINYFRKEAPLSPYDELRKKNIQLLDLSEKLKESENQYRLLTETLPLMIFTTNAGGYITYGNKWLKDYFNIQDLQPNKTEWLSLLYPSENKGAREEWEKALFNKIPLRTQAKLKTKNKNVYIWHLISLLPVKQDGHITGWTGFFVDIQAQKLVEETLKNNDELKAAQRQLLNYQSKLEENIKALQSSNHDLEQFAYIASHDLQEPLRKIRNFTELLEKNITDKEKSIKYLSKIDSSSERMSVLIRDVLNYSRLSRQERIFEETNLQQILQNVKTDVELLIEEKQALIESDPLPVIIGIPLQLHQLFYNLINNSLKFTKDRPHIRIRCHKLGPAEIKQHPELHNSVNYIQLTFTDNGIGFEQKHANQIFIIFKRLHSRESFEGTGIGLALCKKIVDNHHGIISVESEPGKGTSFRVILPME